MTFGFLTPKYLGFEPTSDEGYSPSEFIRRDIEPNFQLPPSKTQQHNDDLTTSVSQH
jgi:hypothetical protein